LGGKEIMRGESRWHGVCLAVAEMARRGLVRGELVAEAVTWVLKVCGTLSLKLELEMLIHRRL
jgi:hypothetical protein